MAMRNDVEHGVRGCVSACGYGPETLATPGNFVGPQRSFWNGQSDGASEKLPLAHIEKRFTRGIVLLCVSDGSSGGSPDNL